MLLLVFSPAEQARRSCNERPQNQHKKRGSRKGAAMKDSRINTRKTSSTPRGG